MLPSPKNRAIIAAAGARKTQTIVDEALADRSKRILVTTYTTENLRQIEARIAQQGGGVMPPNIQVKSWFSFLLGDGIRPYQSFVFGEIGLVKGLNFVGQRHRSTPKARTKAFFLDSNGDAYRNTVADLACRANSDSGGLVVTRIEAMYDHIYVDEVQDLVGYDLDFLDLLFGSAVGVTIVGDPRQHTFGTNEGSRNQKYRGAGFMDWLGERSKRCGREDRHESYRCNQAICDFASALFPNLPPMKSKNEVETGHDGIFHIAEREVGTYVHRHAPQILRHDKKTNTLGLPAMNFGVSKGSTFDRVLIFPTGPMRAYLKTLDPSPLDAPEKFYVAVTRAKYSVTFVRK